MIVKYMSACYDTLLQAWGTLDYMLHLKPPTDIYVMAVNAVKKKRQGQTP